MSNILRRAAVAGLLGIGGLAGLGASEARSCDKPLGGPIGPGYPQGGYAGGYDGGPVGGYPSGIGGGYDPRGYPGPGFEPGYQADYGRTDVAYQHGYRPMPVAAPVYRPEPPIPVNYQPASYREYNRTTCTSVREVERTYPAPMPYGRAWPW